MTPEHGQNDSLLKFNLDKSAQDNGAPDLFSSETVCLQVNEANKSLNEEIVCQIDTLKEINRVHGLGGNSRRRIQNKG